jgi:hypothetical protein
MNKEQFRITVEQMNKGTLDVLDAAVTSASTEMPVECVNELVNFKSIIERLIEIEMDLIKLTEKSEYIGSITRDLLSILGIAIIGCNSPQKFSKDVQKIMLLLIGDKLSELVDTNPSNSINGKGEELIKEFEEKNNA